MTLPGAPCVYYGDELGLTGGYEPGCRNTIPWEQVDALKGDLWRATREAIALRKAHPVLRRGSYATVLAEGDLLAYRRELDGTQALVIFNTGRQPTPVALPFQARDVQVAYGRPSDLVVADGQARCTVPARGGVVLVSA